MEEGDNWTPVSVSGRRAVSLNQGRATVQWDLDGGFNRDWAKGFSGVGSKTGSGAYALTDSAPRAKMTKVIEWSVPEGDIEDADSYVKSSVAAANQTYQSFVSQQAEQSRQNEAQAKAKQAQLDEVQRRLDSLE